MMFSLASPVYLLNQWLIAPVLFFGYLLFEPESPVPPWVELSFFTAAALCCAVFFYALYPRGKVKWKRRLQRGGFLIGALLLWQSLVAYYPYLYRECAQRWKVWNWAFGEGIYECPPPSKHHISLKYCLECTADFVGSVTQLLFVPFVILYRKVFGGGWLNPKAWLSWILLYGTACFFGYVYLGGSVRDLVAVAAHFAM